MQEPITLTDATLDQVLQSNQPVFILFTNGDGLRGDFKVAYNKLAQENRDYTIARIDPTRNPQAAARFDVGDRPVLVGVYCGAEIVRRLRPWGTDLPLALEQMQAQVELTMPAAAAEKPLPAQLKEKPNVIANKPVHVTDATFETEVMNSDLPVLVDFWAEWCGPCRMVGPVLDKLAGEFAGQIKIAKVDVDANQGLSQAFRIMSIPNLMIVKSKTIIFNQPGALPENALRDLIQQAIAFEVPPRQPQPTPDSQ